MKTSQLNLPKITPASVERSFETAYMGVVDTSYWDLVRVFGEPHRKGCFGDRETDVEWTFVTEDERVFTLYNYKDGPCYLGERGTPVKDIRKWHIGGRDGLVVDVIKGYLEEGIYYAGDKPWERIHVKLSTKEKKMGKMVEIIESQLGRKGVDDRGRGRNRGNKPGSGPGGTCICPECSYEEPHETGVACYEKKCPVCNVPLRKE